MNRLAVLAERLAVIRGDCHERAVADAEPRQSRVESADEFVGPGDLAVVWLARIAGRIRLRRLVGRVRIVQVDPDEGARARMPFEPSDRLADRDVAAFLENVEEARFVLRVGSEVEAIGELVETAAESRLR